MIQLFGIGQQNLYQGEKPVRDPGYLRFIRSLICICCGKTRYVEAAHFGPHGLNQKASDLDTLPLCRWCHRTGPNSYHKLGPRRFAAVHQLDVPKHQKTLREFYFTKVRKAA